VLFDFSDFSTKENIITAGDGAKVAINGISEINGDRYVDQNILKDKKEGRMIYILPFFLSYFYNF